MIQSIRSVTSVLALGFSVASTLAPRSAAAQTAPAMATTDVLTLRDGTVLRGQIAELRPGRAVTLMLLSGEARTVAWDALAAPPTTVATVVAAPRSEQDEYLTPSPGRVPVDIAAPGGHVVVGVQTGGGTSFASGSVGGRAFFAGGQSETHSILCEAPCRLYVRPGYLPLWTGGGANHAALTEVRVPATGMRLDAHASSHAAWWGGIFTATLGATVLLTGSLLFVMPPEDSDPSPCYVEDTCRAVAIGLMAGGALATIGGVWLGATNGGGVTPAHVPQWTAAVTPTQGGAMLAATARF